MMTIRALLLTLTCVLLTACGGDGGGGASPSGPAAGVPSDTDTNGTGSGDTGGGDGPSGPADNLIELVSGLATPRDLIFGPPGSGLDDELFVVSFLGAEATWVRNFGQSTQSLQPSQGSLVGAIAVDMDSQGRFYFACMTPVMGAFVGVVTVRGIDNTVTDFQYRGLGEPTGVALNGEGGLFVFNRSDGSVVRLDLSDGAGADNHAVTTIAEGLQVTDEVLPNHLLVDEAGRLLICETGAGRLLVYEDGEVLTLAGPDQGLDRPVSLVQLKSGNYLVANNGNGHLVELDAEGIRVSTIDTGLGSGRLQAVATDADGAIHIVDDTDGVGSVYLVEIP